MAASYRKSSGPVLRSPSPASRFSNSQSPPASYSSSGFASSTSTFSSGSATFFHRSTSPTRANIYGSSAKVSSVRFSFDHCVSPNRSISVAGTGKLVERQSHRQKRTCMCAPTTHPGSFRCTFHKSFGSRSTATYAPNLLNARRSAMTNSLVRIRGVEGDLVKRALAALIRPSSHHQRRHCNFRPRPSRLSVMSETEEDSNRRSRR